MSGKRIRPPVHPGRILKNEFMIPYNLSARKVANHIGVPHNRISEIIAGRRAMTSDTALRLERLFGFSAQAWMNIQQRFDLETAKMEFDLGSTLKDIKRYEVAA